MRKDKLKINFQRIGVLFCACLMVFVGVFGLFPFFGAAVQNVELPIAILFDLTIPTVFDVTLPIRFYVGLQSYSTISVVDSVWSYDDTVVYDGEQWVNEDYRYIYIVSTSVPFDQLLSYLQVVGKIAQISDYYFPVHPSVFYSTSGNVPFVSNEQLFDGISSVGGDYTLLYKRQDGTFLTVYENGAWIDEDYRRVEFLRGFFPLTYDEYNLWLDNEYVPSFLDRVTSGLTAVIAWVGAVASAVISGPLSPLLGLVAVGIALSAILLVIYLVRRFIWGA